MTDTATHHLEPTSPGQRSQPQPQPQSQPQPQPQPRAAAPRSPGRWNRFSLPQLLIMALATVPLLIIGGALGAGAVGAITTEAMIDLALAAGENPGNITFGAMFLASPVQWWTGRTQVRVRKYLGIAFFLMALSNGAMFVVESGIGGVLAAPFLVAGTAALLLAVPLFATSSRWSQRHLGMDRWRSLHKLTYLIAAALVAHVLLIGDVGLGFVLISAGFVARIPPVRRRLQRRNKQRSVLAA